MPSFSKHKTYADKNSQTVSTAKRSEHCSSAKEAGDCKLVDHLFEKLCHERTFSENIFENGHILFTFVKRCLRIAFLNRQDTIK